MAMVPKLISGKILQGATTLKFECPLNFLVLEVRWQTKCLISQVVEDP